MSKAVISRPESAEYAPDYDKYVSLIQDKDVLSALSDQLAETLTLLNGISEEKANYRYESDKWSIKELIGHIVDCERIMCYRALRMARNDKTPIEGFEQDDYVKYGSFDECSLADLIEEYKAVRHANLLFFRKLSNEAWLRKGTANNNEISVRALAYIIAGHEVHHIGILKERYLS